MLDRNENFRPQKSHSNFFSLVWVIIWVLRDLEIAPQISHCSILRAFLSGGLPSSNNGFWVRGLRPRRTGDGNSSLMAGQRFGMEDSEGLCGAGLFEPL